jgi:hypothetical protein
VNIRKFIAHIQRLLRLAGIIKPSKEDRLWKQWLELKQREGKDLNEILLSQVAKPYKLRALAVLLAAKREDIPSHWWYDPADHRGNWHGRRGVEFEKLPLKLVRAGANLVCKMRDEHPDEDYEKEILQLLSILPEDDPLAEELFERFSLKDLETGNGPGYTSGFNPFQWLMLDWCDGAKIGPVRNKWKYLADQRMRHIVELEASGQSQPREIWEDALEWYAETAFSFSKEKNSPKDLVLSQVQFVVEIAKSNENIQYYLCYWYCRFQEPEHKDLRRRIAFLLKSDASSRYMDREIAEQMAAEFSDIHEIAEPILAYIEERKARDRENERLKYEMIAKECAVLADMAIA